MRPLRFALVTTSYPPYAQGDDGLAVQWLARALAARGHFVEVVHDTDIYRSRTGRVPVRPERDHGVRVHRLRGGLRGSLATLGARLTGGEPAYAGRLGEILNGRFDVTHFHDIEPIGGAALWDLGSGVKLQSLEDYWVVCPKGDLMRRPGATCDKFDCTRCLISNGRLPRPRVADQMAMPGEATPIDAFLVHSHAARQRHRDAGFQAAMRLVPPFLPGVAPVLKTAEAPVQERPYFLYDGPLTPQSACLSLVSEFSEDIDADLLVLGRGPDASAIRRIARNRSNIHFLGPRPKVPLQALTREALAMVLPREVGGQIPRSALAASREGTPLIVAEEGAGAEFVAQTGGGYKYKTAPELRAIFYRLAHDPVHAQELGRRAFSGYARQWREDVAVEAYFDVIRDVAVRRGLSGLLAKLEPDLARHA